MWFRDLFLELLTNPTATHPIVSHHDRGAEQEGRVIDVYTAASRVTYDIIGEIAIDHQFNALSDPHGEGGELFENYERMQQVVTGSSATRQDLAVLFPILEKIAVSRLVQTKLMVANGKYTSGQGSHAASGRFVEAQDRRETARGGRGETIRVEGSVVADA